MPPNVTLALAEPAEAGAVGAAFAAAAGCFDAEVEAAGGGAVTGAFFFVPAGGAGAGPLPRTWNLAVLDIDR